LEKREERSKRQGFKQRHVIQNLSPSNTYKNERRDASKGLFAYPSLCATFFFPVASIPKLIHPVEQNRNSRSINLKATGKGEEQ